MLNLKLLFKSHPSRVQQGSVSDFIIFSSNFHHLLLFTIKVISGNFSLIRQTFLIFKIYFPGPINCDIYVSIMSYNWNNFRARTHPFVIYFHDSSTDELENKSFACKSDHRPHHHHYQHKLHEASISSNNAFSKLYILTIV